jgi:hypothetical protein
VEPEAKFFNDFSRACVRVRGSGVRSDSVGHDRNAIKLVEGNHMVAMLCGSRGGMQLSASHDMTIADYIAISILFASVLYWLIAYFL